MELTHKINTFMATIWNRGEFSELAQFVHPQYQVLDDPGDPWNGKTLDLDQFKSRVLYSRNAFPDLNFEIHETIEGSEKVAIRWTMSGTHRGDLPMLAATNKPFKISGMTFYYFKDGKVCGHRQAFDQLGFLSQVQAFPGH